MKIASLLASAAILLAGCQSYDIVSTSIFANEDGEILRVDYGRSDSDHTSTFTAPNGRELDFKTRLVVDVTLPDGDDFTAWQCMNMFRSGTVYRTDDKEWVYHTNGIRCIVYREEEDETTGKTRYAEVFRGEICDAPMGDKGRKEVNPKERKMKKNAEGQWK